jgi:hypothetical protein
MTHVSTGQPCRQHFWERCLEVHGGVECVVRFCRTCGWKEVCWSRHALSREVVAALNRGRDQKN